MPADLVVAPHHGSRTSSGPALVAATRPAWVVFSTNWRNRWGFPAPAVVERWQRAGAVPLSTERHGEILIRFDPHGPRAAIDPPPVRMPRLAGVRPPVEAWPRLVAQRRPLPVSSATTDRSRGAMIEIIRAGGWLMLPIILCSIVAVAITIERLWTLQRRRVLPRDLTMRVWEWARGPAARPEAPDRTLGEFADGARARRGLANRHQSREVLKEIVQDTGRHVVHELERYLNSLGTIAAITPLLGLLGTVIGMVKVFTAITTAGWAIPACSRAASPRR
jgi:biopolymer transport protein ExbB/TolQ